MNTRYVNRELSWIAFNERVLSEAENPEVPLLERLKFLSIVGTNFDEFFMVRVAGLWSQVRSGAGGSCPTGMRPHEQLSRVLDEVRRLDRRRYRLYHEVLLPSLAEHRIRHTTASEWSARQRLFLRTHFSERIFPLLTPLRIETERSGDSVGNLLLHVAFQLDGPEPGFAMVRVPQSLDRIVYLPDDDRGVVCFALLEEVMIEHAAALFPGYSIAAAGVFRVTRDADFAVDEERDDFVAAMAQVVQTRDRSNVVRLDVNVGSGAIRSRLVRLFELDDERVFETPGPLDTEYLTALSAIDGYPHLRDEAWPAQSSVCIDADEPVWDSVRRRDVMLYHPYERFDPVVRLIQEAADDPDTLALKMTLYRTSGDSPIIAALERAARNGVQVTAFVELKARFDEQRNIAWTRRLEQAGVIVAYGIAGLKVHAKALLVVRRGVADRIERIVHVGTGNYHDKTVRHYTDIGLLTMSPEITHEVALLFNAITGHSVIPQLKTLVMAPTAMKPRLLELIARETARARSQAPAGLTAKINSLADTDVIDALYQASRAGVRIELNVRGICMLVPGVPGQSENIRVVSVIDRYLEHARVFVFANGGNPEVYIASADWMPRNLEKRVELMTPIEDPEIRGRIQNDLRLFFSDTSKAHHMQPDGSWRRVVGRPPVRAQHEQYRRLAARAGSVGTESRHEFKVRRKPPVH